MNKGDLVNDVAKVVSRKIEAQATVDCLFSSVTQALKNDDAVMVIGFGTFKVQKRKERKKPSDWRRDSNQGKKYSQVHPGNSSKRDGATIMIHRLGATRS